MKRARLGLTVVREIDPDEIFLDSSNLPAYDTAQAAGKADVPVSRRSIYAIGGIFLVVSLLFSTRAFSLQVAHGASYAEVARDNTLDKSVRFASRGLLLDRNGKPLAWNVPNNPAATSSASAQTFALREYVATPGFSDLLGFVKYPKADKSGEWWNTNYAGMAGAELSLNDALNGTNGDAIDQRDARGKIVQENIVEPAQDGKNVTLSIDADVQAKLFDVLSKHAAQMHFQGGAGIIMDVNTGAVLAITSFPEYDSQSFTDGDAAAIRAASNDPSTPMLDRAISGLYAPGSIVKPIFAAAALNENLISPDKLIVSTGKITIPNPYDPSNPSVFHDWTVHGPIDMRTALAVSSDEYFYTVGGGYGDQPGLGIARLDKYASSFGLGTTTGIDLPGEVSGTVPGPQWKAEIFNGAPWLLGDTYHTSIGQYGFQVTPIQAVRYVAAIANGGTLYTPKIIASSTPESLKLGIPDDDLEVVREGMRLGVTSNRTDAIEKFLNIPGIEIAGKTGTAQIGSQNQWENSWAIGFWPASHPKYAYAVVLEHAPAGTASGAAPGLLPFFQWLVQAHPEYAQ